MALLDNVMWSAQYSERCPFRVRPWTSSQEIIMKTFIACLTLALAGVAGAAQADQVDLYTAAGFGALHQYHGVTTSLCTQDPCEPAGLVTIYLPQSGTTGSMQLWFGDEVNPTTSYFYSYWVGQYAGTGNASVLQKCVFPMDATNSYSVGPCVLNGETIVVTLNETSRVVRGSGSGRGGYASHTLWTLQNGTIVGDGIVPPPPPPPSVVAVPDVVSQDAAVAQSRIEGLGLSFSAAYVYSASIPANTVVATTPSANTLVDAGTSVQVVVSLGSQVVGAQGTACIP